MKELYDKYKHYQRRRLYKKSRMQENYKEKRTKIWIGVGALAIAASAGMKVGEYVAPLIHEFGQSDTLPKIEGGKGDLVKDKGIAIFPKPGRVITVEGKELEINDHPLSTHATSKTVDIVSFASDGFVTALHGATYATTSYSGVGKLVSHDWRNYSRQGEKVAYYVVSQQMQGK